MPDPNRKPKIERKVAHITCNSQFSSVLSIMAMAGNLVAYLVVPQDGLLVKFR